MNFYALYDKNLKLSNIPFDAYSDDHAILLLSNTLEKVSSDVRDRVIKSCDLYFCGTFDEKTGIFGNLERRFVASCSDFSVVKKED